MSTSGLGLDQTSMSYSYEEFLKQMQQQALRGIPAQEAVKLPEGAILGASANIRSGARRCISLPAREKGLQYAMEHYRGHIIDVPTLRRTALAMAEWLDGGEWQE